jgi:Hypervirulence associated proteins TUDOR domain
MSDTPKSGDRVEWESSQGKVTGKVKKKLTKPTEIKGHHVAASPENPEILVESEKTGAVAAHKPEALKKAPKKKGGKK